MSRKQRDPLRSLQDTERVSLVRLSRSASAPAAQVARARALLAVADGLSYTAAAQLVGRHNGDTVARWSRVSTIPGWPQSCRAMAAASHSATARSSSAVSSPRLPGRRTARVMARRVGR
jgi:hypothetical protein